MMSYYTIWSIVIIATFNIREISAAAAQFDTKTYKPLGSSCTCGYYIPESGLTLTNTSLLDPSQFDPTLSIDDNLATQGWSSSNYVFTNNPVSTRYTSENARLTQDGLLNLVVSASHGKTITKGAEITTNIDSVRYGSFRFTTQVSKVPGACHGMFYYHNDNQEIDLEILSRFVHNSTNKNTQIQNPPGLQMTIQALTTSTSEITYSHPFDGYFDPTMDFHEYRFDWSSKAATFYADGKKWGQITKKIPTQGGQIIINNWTNGNKYWTGAPPAKNANFYIRQAVLYYNTTDASLNRAWASKCTKSKDKRICYVL